jgi:hypothetical protein
LYVNNVYGDDSNDGLSRTTPKKSIQGAVGALPPVLRHPCAVFLIETNVPYSIDAMKKNMKTIYLGDGDVQQIKHYAIEGLSHTIQEEGRLFIGRDPSNTTDYITITAEGFAGFGDGPTSAFVVTDTRVVFSGVRFQKFLNASVYIMDSNVDFVDCVWDNNFIGVSITDGSSVVVSRSNLILGSSGTGFILSESSMTNSDLTLSVSGIPNSAFVCERSANLTLMKHDLTHENGVVSSTPIVLVKLNSNLVCSQDFTSAGKATLVSNSTMTRTVSVNPFAGGISTDVSSVVATDVS